MAKSESESFRERLAKASEGMRQAIANMQPVSSELPKFKNGSQVLSEQLGSIQKLLESSNEIASEALKTAEEARQKADEAQNKTDALNARMLYWAVATGVLTGIALVVSVLVAIFK